MTEDVKWCVFTERFVLLLPNFCPHKVMNQPIRLSSQISSSSRLLGLFLNIKHYCFFCPFCEAETIESDVRSLLFVCPEGQAAELKEQG